MQRKNKAKSHDEKRGEIRERRSQSAENDECTLFRSESCFAPSRFGRLGMEVPLQNTG